MDYSDLEIKLSRKVNGSDVVSYLEKAAADIGMYTEKKDLAGRYCSPFSSEEKAVSLSFFKPLKFLYLYSGQFSISVCKNKEYSSLKVLEEPLASHKKTLKYAEKLQERLWQLLK
jgi:hypothetical protein